ncbi:MAG: SOS response-associated peptidase [Armatimonadetes bacterium]|nr:SOS response-associated peptidase [Armatimonadota bacterium]
MCARYSLKSSANVLQELFDLDDVPEIVPRYNIAPTQPILAVIRESRGALSDHRGADSQSALGQVPPTGRPASQSALGKIVGGGRQTESLPHGKNGLRWFHWGLIPSWAKDPSIGQRMINARAETLLEKPSYRAAFKRRRCLIPADDFFEWVEVKPKPEAVGILDFGEDSDFAHRPSPIAPAPKPYKQPYYIHSTDGLPLAFAGLYEYWETPEGGPIESCTIITTSPNELMKTIHDRMPAILEPSEFDEWLGTDELEAKYLISLLDPYPSEKMALHPVSRSMSNPRYAGPDCIEAI